MSSDQTLDFCTLCFASSEDGSWGCTTSEGHCYNCGAGGAAINIPKWAIESIRKNGSWVCKRAYPSQEDREQVRELRYLRSVHGGQIYLSDSESTPGFYTAWRYESRDRTVSFSADNHTDAVAKALQSLPVLVPTGFVTK